MPSSTHGVLSDLRSSLIHDYKVLCLGVGVVLACIGQQFAQVVVHGRVVRIQPALCRAAPRAFCTVHCAACVLPRCMRAALRCAVRVRVRCTVCALRCVRAALCARCAVCALRCVCAALCVLRCVCTALRMHVCAALRVRVPAARRLQFSRPAALLAFPPLWRYWWQRQRLLNWVRLG